MYANQKNPTPQQVRDWLAETVKSNLPPASPEEIRQRLWSTERLRKQVMS